MWGRSAWPTCCLNYNSSTSSTSRCRTRRSRASRTTSRFTQDVHRSRLERAAKAAGFKPPPPGVTSEEAARHVARGLLMTPLDMVYNALDEMRPNLKGDPRDGVRSTGAELGERGSGARAPGPPDETTRRYSHRQREVRRLHAGHGRPPGARPHSAHGGQDPPAHRTGHRQPRHRRVALARPGQSSGTACPAPATSKTRMATPRC